MLCHVFVFEAVIHQVLRGDAARQEAADLLDEALFDAFVEPAVDAGDAVLA